MVNDLPHGEILGGSRHKCRNGIFEAQLVALNQLQYRDSEVDVDHLADVEHRVRCRQTAACNIAQAVTRHARDLGGLNDRDGHAGNLFLGHEGGNYLADGLSSISDVGIAALRPQAGMRRCQEQPEEKELLQG